MAKKTDLIEEPTMTLSMHPKKFALWLFIVTVVMIFAALTSAYIVRQAEGDWFEFTLPAIFWISSGIILLSSFTMHWAYLSAKKDNLETVKLAMAITVTLGLAFLVAQFFAWGELVKIDVFFVGNPSGSFVYVLTGLHAVHLLSAIIFLVVVLVATYNYKVHSKNMSRMEMCTTYWHFFDGLWLYLFLFLLLNN